MPASPPALASTVGSARMNPASNTVSCTTLTHAVPSSPPAMKVVVTTTALMTVPSHRGTPATTSSTAAPAMSCPAKIDSVPSQISIVTSARTSPP